MAKISGNKNNNTLFGTGGDDIIYGKGGSDTIYGKAGNDLIYGGALQDVMYGGYGKDTFVVTGNANQIGGPFDGDYFDGGKGIDTVDLSGLDFYRSLAPYATFVDIERFIMTSSADTLHLGSGMAGMTVYGRGGGDTIDSYTYDATIYGGSGADRIRGLQNNYDDVFYGGNGDDFLAGFGGDDKLYGGDGDDVIQPGLGKDVMKGGAGADEFDLAGSFNVPPTYTEKLWTGKGRDLIRIEDNYREAKTLVVYDFSAKDSIIFNDLTFGDALDLPDNFREFKDAARNTKAGVKIEIMDGQYLILRGLEKSDLDPEQFDFFQA